LQAQSATASLPAGAAASAWQAAGAASPPAQWKLAAHGAQRPSASRAKPGRQAQKPVSGDTEDLHPSSEHTHWLWLVAPACGVVEPGGHGVQLVRLIVGA
jgi:hypothetical protein